MTENYTINRDFATQVLSWYDQNARDLPWRVGPEAREKGVRPDPYFVWLSEIMLQQTTIPHATRYFLEFTRRWPDVFALAAAERDEIMAAWAGLGYYSRARNLYACAQIVADKGGFPETAAELIRLPGIGPYTSGAIAAIAFDEKAAAVDGNVERVMSRYLAIEQPLREIKPRLRQAVEGIVPLHRPGDFAQAMMDLGATVCTPRSPSCDACPLHGGCKAFELGDVTKFPVKSKAPAKPRREGTAFIHIENGELTLERRPDTGLLAGMVGLPTTEWITLDQSAKADSPSSVGQNTGFVEHVFTHFHLTLHVNVVESIVSEHPVRVPIKAWDKTGLPSVFQKAVRLYLKHQH